MFEAVHGSAPDIAGQQKANPTALLLASALLLDHCGLYEKAARLRSALAQVLANPGTRTVDLARILHERARVSHFSMNA
jgi:isocitrate dehydrogenase (NAD+)